MPKRDNAFDSLCQSLFGFTPKKAGTSFEIITDCVIGALKKSYKLDHNAFISSSYSADEFQLDGIAEDEFTKVKAFIECKNYNASGAPVGRDDIQKLAGGLLVLNDIDQGIFSSATGYTKPAQQYSKDLKAAGQKPIELYTIRPSTDADLNGRIRTIELNFIIVTLDFDHAAYAPEFTKEAMEKLISMGDRVGIKVDKIYNSLGNIIYTMEELTAQVNGKYDLQGGNALKEVQGKWDFGDDGFLKIDGEDIQIKSIEYKIPVLQTVETVMVTGKDPLIYVRTADGSIDKLITAKELKEQYKLLTRYNDAGEIIKIPEEE